MQISKGKREKKSKADSVSGEGWFPERQVGERKQSQLNQLKPMLIWRMLNRPSGSSQPSAKEEKKRKRDRDEKKRRNAKMKKKKAHTLGPTPSAQSRLVEPTKPVPRLPPIAILDPHWRVIHSLGEVDG